MWTPLICRGLRFLENHRRGESRYYCKNESLGKYCFPLMMYGFCSNNALYSASLSFTIFIFILNPFNTWDCNYFESNLVKHEQEYGKQFFPAFKFVIISFRTWKPNPLGLGNCSVPNFCKTSFRYFSSLFTGTYDKFVPYTTGLFMSKKSKLLIREGWFRVFPKLRVEDHNKNCNIQYFLSYR